MVVTGQRANNYTDLGWVGNSRSAIRHLLQPRCDRRHCSRELTLNPHNLSHLRGHSTGFMVIMETGRVGSTWLQELLNFHPNITCYHEELAGSAETFESGARRTKLLFDYKLFPGKKTGGTYTPTYVRTPVFGAMQRASVWLPESRELPVQMLSGMSMVCLARSNPAELASALLNGKSHQEACGHHVLEAGSDCNYTLALNTSTREFRSTASGLLQHSAAFRGYCEHLSLSQRTFWLEYKDLLCDTEKTLHKLHAFLQVRRIPAPTSTRSVKLSKPITGQRPSPLSSSSGMEGLLSWGIQQANQCDESSCKETPAFCYS